LYEIEGFGDVSPIGRPAAVLVGETVLKPPGSSLENTLWARDRAWHLKGSGMRVLVIEDDEEMAQAIAFGLRQTGIAVDVALDGPGGLQRSLVNDYDVIVLDRDLPGIHGDQICAQLAGSDCRSRVLMLTAASLVEDLVDGLGLGADDYLAKPFDFPVLVARIGALTRRAQPAIPPTLRSHDVVLDTARHRACRAGRQLELAPKEFGVLELLLAAQGRSVSAEELLARVWDEAADPFTNAVKITVSRLRSKLGDPPIIETVAKSGYRI
jgi:DNA-binding response OmpR family regulator